MSVLRPSGPRNVSAMRAECARSCAFRSAEMDRSSGTESRTFRSPIRRAWIIRPDCLGHLARYRDALGSFDIGPNPFRETAYANRVRHVGLLVRGGRLLVFFTAIGDAPER